MNTSSLIQRTVLIDAWMTEMLFILLNNNRQQIFNTTDHSTVFSGKLNFTCSKTA